MNKNRPWYVYILKCAGEYFYTGISPDVGKRISKHKEGIGAKFTKTRPPEEIVYIKKYLSLSEALKIEREIKRYSRIKKEQLIKAFKDTNSSQDVLLELNEILA